MHRKLIVLNGIAILGVVVNHSVAWGFVAMFWWTHRYSSVTPPNFDQMFGSTYFGLRSVEQFITFSIPAFLLVSGYFISATTSSTNNRVSYRLVLTRIKSLVIPFLIWTAVIVGLDLALGEAYSLNRLLRAFFLGQATPAFYFVPLLIQLYMLSPLLLLGVKRRPALLMLFAGGLQILSHLAVYAFLLEGSQGALESLQLLTHGWFFPGNIFWFVFGIYMGVNRNRVVEWLNRHRIKLILAAIVLLPLGIAEWEIILGQSSQVWLTPKETLFDNVYSIVILLALLANLGSNLPQMQRISQLGTKSYGIYLVHSIALTLAARAIYHIAPGILAFQWLFVPLLVVAGLAIPLALMALVKRSPLAVAYPFLFG